MGDGALYSVLTILALGVALNLKLTFSLLKAVRNMGTAAVAGLPVGEPIPDVRGRTLLTRQPLSLSSLAQPAVLVFLSSRCPKCRQSLPEVQRMLPLVQAAGVELHLVSREPAWRVRQFLRATRLAQIVVMLGTKDYKALNPTKLSPSYLFINQSASLEASGMIGDENWLSFVSQMDEIEAQLGVAA